MIDLVDEVGSTNDAMLARAAAGASEGDWLVALRQTSGRGRQGRTWSTPDGNLAASGLVRLCPRDPPAPTLALVAGLAVHDLAAACLPAGCGPMLKWPNDLLVDGAKLAGILLERRDDAVVVGVGVNLAAAPTGVGRPVTSLPMLGAAAPAAAEAAAMLAKAFARHLAVWRREGLAPVRAAWSARAHPPGTPLRVQVGPDVRDGVFDGLAADGSLRLLTAQGPLTVTAGDVFLL